MDGKKDIFNFRLTPETRQYLELLSKWGQRSKTDTLRLLLINAARPILDEKKQKEALHANGKK
jgi:predicted DNA-binding protein